MSGNFRSELLPKRVKQDLRRGQRRVGTREEYAIGVLVVEYMVTNRGAVPETIRLITSIADPDAAPAAELAALYPQRWGSSN